MVMMDHLMAEKLMKNNKDSQMGQVTSKLKKKFSLDLGTLIEI